MRLRLLYNSYIYCIIRCFFFHLHTYDGVNFVSVFFPLFLLLLMMLLYCCWCCRTNTYTKTRDHFCCGFYCQARSNIPLEHCKIAECQCANKSNVRILCTDEMSTEIRMKKSKKEIHRERERSSFMHKHHEILLWYSVSNQNFQQAFELYALLRLATSYIYNRNERKRQKCMNIATDLPL